MRTPTKKDKIKSLIKELEYAIDLLESDKEDLAEFTIGDVFNDLNSLNYVEFPDWYKKFIKVLPNERR